MDGFICDEPPRFPIIFTIEGKPVPLKRHRTTRTGHRYDPSAKDKEIFLEKVRQTGQMPEVALDQPLRVDLTFGMPRAKSHYRTGRYAGQLKGGAPVHHVSVPDVDNLAKFVLDSLNTHIFVDDSRIVEIHCRKIYAEDRVGYTTMKVTPVI